MCYVKELHLKTLCSPVLCLLKYKAWLVCTAILLTHYRMTVELRSSYAELYSLMNDSLPETFWHSYYNSSRTPIRHSANLSLENESVIVLACGRDVSTSINYFKKNVYSIVKYFKHYHILLGESDSKDNTLWQLHRWEKSDKHVHVYTYGSLERTYSKYRTHRIAFCRNNLLETVRNKNWINESRFLLVMDIDINANTILSVDNFLTNFDYDAQEWAVMTASQTKAYYDIWALRTDVVNYDCWALMKSRKDQKIARQFYIDVHTKPIPNNFGLIPVHSAFGGFAVYQTDYLTNCYYDGVDPIYQEKCEHVSFNQCVLKNGGKIFINPRFQNAEGLKH